MGIRRASVRIAAALIVLSAVAACTSTSPVSPARGVVPTLTVADRESPRALNPLLIGGLSEDLQVLLFSCLLRSGPRGRLVPDVAARIPTLENGDVAAGGRRITYHLRSGLRWQDGTPLTASDVVYTYRQIMNPRNDTGARVPYIDVASASAPDDRTLVVNLSRVDAAFVPKFFAGSFCWGILPEHVLHGYTSLNTVPFNAAPIGSGPYRVASWKRGEELVLEPNAQYVLGAPHIRIVDRFVPDSSSTLTGLRTGELDADFHADLQETRTLAGDPRYRIVHTPQAAAGALLFNLGDPALRDPALRRAIGYAIDNGRIARQLFGGAFETREPERAMFAFGYDPSVSRAHFDLRRADRMLDALGWRAGSDGLRRRNGRTLSLSLVASSSGFDPSVCVQLQYALHEAGIDVTIKTVDDTTLYALDGPLRAGRFQLAYLPMYWIDFDDDLTSEVSCTRFPPRGFNFGRYCDSAVDRATAAALTTLDQRARAGLYRIVQQRFAANPPWLTLWRISKTEIVPAALHNFASTPRYDPYYGVQTWRLAGH